MYHNLVIFNFINDVVCKYKNWDRSNVCTPCFSYSRMFLDLAYYGIYGVDIGFTKSVFGHFIVCRCICKLGFSRGR